MRGGDVLLLFLFLLGCLDGDGVDGDLDLDGGVAAMEMARRQGSVVRDMWMGGSPSSLLYIGLGRCPGPSNTALNT